MTLFMKNDMSKIHHYRHFTKFTRSDQRLPKSESERLSHDLNTVPIITSTHVELLEKRGVSSLRNCGAAWARGVK